MKVLSKFILVMFILVSGLYGARTEVIEESFDTGTDLCKMDIEIDAGSFHVQRSSSATTLKMRIEYNPSRCDIDYYYDEDDSEFELEIDHHGLGNRDNVGSDARKSILTCRMTPRLNSIA